jgi:hypothetical protein
VAVPARRERDASYRGFDYLGDALARQGFVTISISAAGLNAVDPSGADGDTARAVQWQASTANLSDWPSGVRVRAVLPLAAVDPAIDGTPEQYLTAPGIPFMSTFGTCDQGGFSSVAEGHTYFEEARTRPAQPATIRTGHLIGGNHNYFNTRWSPSSGLPAAGDEALHAGPPGTCVSDADGMTNIPQLSETTERQALVTYASAFFRRYLDGDWSADPVLDGKARPFPVEISKNNDRP